MPNGRLFHSPLGLYTFQAEAVAEAYLYGNRLAVIDRGLGKTVVMMALACQLFEDNEIDLVICVGQGNKIADRNEFEKDWRDFTSLRVHRYLGTGRVQRLTKALAGDGVDVLMTTYETGKIDLMTRVKTSKRGKGSRRDGPLVEQLGLRGKRILWVFDEVVKFANRGSELYQAFDYLIGPPGHGGGQLRAGEHRQRALGLSGNPFSSDQYVQSFNVGRLICPDQMPSIGEFDSRFTYGKDDRDMYLYRGEARTEFAPMFQRLIYRKRNSDPDVKAQMPELIEKQIDVTLDPAHRQLYAAIQGLFGKDLDELTDEQKGQLYGALKLALGHPRALLHSDAMLPTAIVRALGADGLAQIPSSKTLRLLDELRAMAGQQVIVFTFYAETVLPELVADLREAGFRVGTYVGNDAASQRDKEAFKAGQVDVLVSSDAGARGLNLPEASYVIEYEPSGTFDQRMQRFGRHQRITSGAAHVYGLTLVTKQTVEVGTIRTMLRRNETQDQLLGDEDAEGYMTAGRRKAMLADSRS